MLKFIDDMSDYLISGYWDFSENASRSGPRKFASASLSVHWGNLQEDDRLLAQEALQYWGAISGLSFSMTTNKADADLVLRNGKQSDQAWAWSSLDKTSDPDFNLITKSIITISKDFAQIHGDINGPEDFLGSYRFGTFVHEIGHALGLGHQGEYNGDTPRPSEILFEQDTLQYSVMSYNEHPHFWLGVNDDTTTLPGLVDIAAIQKLYGTNGISNPGDTIYGDRATATQAAYDADYLRTTMVTIFDTGGDQDLLNFSGTARDQTINLKAGVFSDVYGQTGNLVIAYGGMIENAVGGLGNDVLRGNHVANKLEGQAGSDDLIGRRGADALYGQNGHDRLNGQKGADLLVGGEGNDRLNGGAGRDTFEFKNDFGHDTIVGFDAGIDSIDLIRTTIDHTTSYIDGTDFVMQFEDRNASITFQALDLLIENPDRTVAQIVDALF